METHTVPGARGTLVARATRFCLWLETQPGILVVVLLAIYIAMIAAPMRKILWHDELFTFYIAQSPSLEKFIYAVRHVDLQPPLIFLTAWLSHRILGVNEFSTRLPSVIAYFSASLGLFFLLRRRVGSLWAMTAVLLFWFSFYFKYATEARPYGLLIAFFVLSLYCYDKAIDVEFSRHKNLYVMGVLFGNVGMMLSHVLAPFSLMPFGLAELVRSVQRRRLDAPLWIAILAPLGVIAAYLPMMHTFEKHYFPPLFQASLRKIFVFYLKAIGSVWPLLAIAAIGSFCVSRFGRESPRPRMPLPRFGAPRVAFIAAALLPPVLVNLMMMRSAGAFWERYCITTVVVVYVLCALSLGWLSKFGSVAGLAAASLVLTGGLVKTALDYRPAPPMHRLEAIRPDLPMVDSSGLAFLEMDHYENPALLKRVYYLSDREAAIHYRNATLFSGFSEIHKYFPLRARVVPYSQFVLRNKHFVVFGTPESVEDWLFLRLADEGATVREVQRVETPYRDYTVYEVTLR